MLKQVKVKFMEFPCSIRVVSTPISRYKKTPSKFLDFDLQMIGPEATAITAENV